MYIIALIPARSGSKELKHKNIRPYKNIPLLAHSIQTALKSKYINDVYFCYSYFFHGFVGICFTRNMSTRIS